MRGLKNKGDFRSGNPVNWAPSPAHFGTKINWTPKSSEFGNPVVTPKVFGSAFTSPHTFGNSIGGTPVVPTFDPPAGTYALPQVVTVISDGADAVYYTTDGTTPTTASALYEGSVFVPSSETLQAIAVINGAASTAGSAAYVISNP